MKLLLPPYSFSLEVFLLPLFFFLLGRRRCCIIVCCLSKEVRLWVLCTILLQQISINIFTKHPMNTKFTTLTVNQAVQTILDRGAQKLYDKYLQQKLPNHTNEANNDQFHNNLKTLTVKPSKHQKIEVVATRAIKSIPLDNFAARRITVKRHSHQPSPQETSIFKQTNFDSSTKYQTLGQTQITINSHIHHSKEINSMLLQESFKKIPMFIKSDRPSTMHVGRSKAKEDSNNQGQLKLQEVEEKRAATCHVRKRKSIVNVQEKQRFIQLKEQAHYFQDQIEEGNKLRKEKKERCEEEAASDRAQAREEAQIRMNQRRTIEEFQDLKKTLKGKGKANPPITNFQSNEGSIVINGKFKPPHQAHIIQLQFNPEEEQTFSTIEPKHSTISPNKTKSFFCTKLKKKLKLSNQQFTNNGSRQISSIPFVALSYGIVLSQNGLEATASRRRPLNQLTRQKYSQEKNIRFKSHIPIVNSARLAAFNAVDAEHTVQSSFVQNNPSFVEKNLQVTIESKVGVQGSLLWNPRGKSEGRGRSQGIRISNKQLLQRQMLFESKLAMAH